VELSNVSVFAWQRKELFLNLTVIFEKYFIESLENGVENQLQEISNFKITVILKITQNFSLKTLSLFSNIPD
jgi:hypothetical protein